jgi:hypothetical protein
MVHLDLRIGICTTGASAKYVLRHLSSGQSGLSYDHYIFIGYNPSSLNVCLILKPQQHKHRNSCLEIPHHPVLLLLLRYFCDYCYSTTSCMNSENPEYHPIHEEDFDSFDVACARSDAKLMAAMDGCCPRFQTCEDFQKEQVAHYAREAKEAKEATAAKVKAESSLEIFRRISHARDAKRVKAATSAAKKSVKQKKTKRLPSYFTSKKYR